MFDTALLVFIAEEGQDRIDQEPPTLPAMALRQDQLVANQILFLNVQTNTVEMVALLHGETPFQELPDGSFTPNVVEYWPLMEPIVLDAPVLNHVQNLGCMPAMEIEAITVDPDELEGDLTYIGSQCVDEMLKNRRNVNQMAVKRALLSQDLSSTREQLEAMFQAS